MHSKGFDTIPYSDENRIYASTSCRTLFRWSQNLFYFEIGTSNDWLVSETCIQYRMQSEPSNIQILRSTMNERRTKWVLSYITEDVIDMKFTQFSRVTIESGISLATQILRFDNDITDEARIRERCRAVTRDAPTEVKTTYKSVQKRSTMNDESFNRCLKS